jgi:hypothetical protein
MDFSGILIGQKYKCDVGDEQHFGFVKEKRDGLVRVQLTDKVGSDGDPGDPIDRLGTMGLVWLAPEHIHPM